MYSPGMPVAFKTWWGQQYMVGIICPPTVGIGLRWQPKLGVAEYPYHYVHRPVRIVRTYVSSIVTVKHHIYIVYVVILFPK